MRTSRHTHRRPLLVSITMLVVLLVVSGDSRFAAVPVASGALQPVKSNRQPAERPPSLRQRSNRIPHRAARAPKTPDAHTRSGEPRALLLQGGDDPRSLREIAFTGASLRWIDDAGAQGESQLAELGALLLAPYSTPPPMPRRSDIAKQTRRSALVVLTTGERFIAALDGADNDSDAVRWLDPVFGAVSTPMSRIAGVFFGSPSQAALDELATPGEGDEQTRDELLLVNGDRLTGVLGSFTDPIVIEDGSSRIEVPIERVAAMTLANEKAITTGPILWLSNGASLRLRSVRDVLSDAGHATRDVAIELTDGRSATLPRRSIVAITSDVSVLIPLALSDLIAERPNADRWQPEPARRATPAAWGPFTSIGASDLVIPGPTLFRMRIPAGASLLLGLARTPETSQEWAQGMLTLWVNSAPIAELHLQPDDPAQPFTAAVTGEELLITLQPRDAGASGAVVTIVQPVFVVIRDD